MSDEWASLFGYIFPSITSGQTATANAYSSRLSAEVKDSVEEITPLSRQVQSLHLDPVHSVPRYLEDTYLFEISAYIVTVERSDNLSKGEFKIILSETIFHPQGGGQPSDVGWIFIDEDCQFEVLFVQRNGSCIEHLGKFSRRGRAILEQYSNSPVTLRVDGRRRLENAKLHSAGHAIDAAIARCGLGEAMRPSKGYHFPDGPYVEYTCCLEDPLPPKLLEDLNVALLQMVNGSIPTQVQVLSKTSARSVVGDDLALYPDQVRIVTVAGLPCPCGGTHIRSTSELEGLIVTKIKRKQNLVRVSYTFNLMKT